METEVIVALIGLGSASLGALLAGGGYYLKSKMEIMRNKRVVLFHLLEFRHQVVISNVNPKDLVEEYLYVCSAFFEKSGLVLDEGISVNMRELIEGFLVDVLAARSPNIDNEFVRSYEDSLKNLCSTDPVLAFKLRGMDNFHQVIKAKERYVANLGEALEANTPLQIKTFFNKEVREEGDDAIEELIRDLERDISRVSFSCSIFTWIYCQKIFKNKLKSTIKSNKEDIESALGRILEKLVAEIVVKNKNTAGDFSSLK